MRGLFGGILMGIGILIAGLSGLCTLLVAGTSLFGSGSSGDLVSIIPAVLAFGGIPFGIGLGLFFAGRHLIRSQTPSAPPVQPGPPPDPEDMARPIERSDPDDRTE
jgi:hypothetical protein